MHWGTFSIVRNSHPLTCRFGYLTGKKANTMTIGSKRPYDVRKVVAHLRSPSPDFFLISAHRGARWNGVPENVGET